MLATFDLAALTAAARAAGPRWSWSVTPPRSVRSNAPADCSPHSPRRARGRTRTVHRFTHEWEADASLRLRTGDPAVSTVYAATAGCTPNPTLRPRSTRCTRTGSTPRRRAET